MHAPDEVVFVTSLFLVIFTWIGNSVIAVLAISTPSVFLTFIADHPSILITVAFVVLALGCVL